MNHVEVAIKRSAETFRSAVWPYLAEPLGGGELIPVETVTDSGFARLLDTLSMTDAWQVVNDKGMRGLATRVQWVNTSWDTWTIRCELASGRATEYHKLMMQGEWQRPHYIVQAYVNHDGSLLAAAAIKTGDLTGMLRMGWHLRKKQHPQDGNWFIPVPWRLADENGIPTIRVPLPTYSPYDDIDSGYIHSDDDIPW